MTTAARGIDVIPIKVASNWLGHADCHQCTLRETVLFSGLSEQDLNLIHAPIDDMTIPAGGVLYLQNDAAKHVYTVKRGLVKVTRLLPDGTERVVRILRSGDVAGLEASACDHFDNSAFALSEVAVCRIPTAVIRRLSQQSPRLHQTLLQKWASMARDSDAWIVELTHGSSRQRIARLILRLQDRVDVNEVMLFNREEMAMMLGLTIETISRCIAAMTREGILTRLDAIGRHYRMDVARLTAETQSPEL